MSSAVEQHVIYQIANAPLREYPFPHFYVESAFPEGFYRSMRSIGRDRPPWSAWQKPGE
jgi:hypothetical protein